MRINRDGSIYDENGNYYGEHIEFSSMNVDDDNRKMICKIDSQESYERIKELLGNKVKKYSKDNHIYFDESEYNINKLNKFITFFDGCIGKIALTECII